MSKAPPSALLPPVSPPPKSKAVPYPATGRNRHGALLNHITGGAEADTYQPMNVNFGLMPPLEGPKSKKADRKKLYTERARAALKEWLSEVELQSA
jgi:folate-dependent tRNA-U54 methylase TrmFO/GidA